MDIDAFPIIPPIALRLEAWCEFGIEIYPVINPVDYRIFLGTPIRFHDPGSILLLKE
jgi:hypothetical protein